MPRAMPRRIPFGGKVALITAPVSTRRLPTRTQPGPVVNLTLVGPPLSPASGQRRAAATTAATSNGSPVSRSETVHKPSMAASRCRRRSTGRLTGGPLFT